MQSAMKGIAMRTKMTPEERLDLARRMRAHQGLPMDCPGCLQLGTVEQKPFGRRAGDYILTCRECRTQYYWSEK